MDVEKIKQLLSDLQAGNISQEQAIQRLSALPYEDLGFARLDTHRALRRGLPEVVFCQNKTTEQVIKILTRLWQHHDRILATRLTSQMAADVQVALPQAHYNPTSRLLTLSKAEFSSPDKESPYALVVCAGTSDLPVSEEAAQTLEFLGSRVERLVDVGVAGIHRLFDSYELINQADVIVSVAGMEGALTSLIAGLAACPVIGVPTSVGYGAHFNGIAPLLTMLNSCSPGVAVVNIDNGYGAGVYAHLILQRIHKGLDR
ncbi:MAG: nickel pincer cofactor biosynthesis protein LarB [Anaerolineales bacterium]|nr:nickel pincer cofactor biosynthesis protein LarB [Anaerolineales bacterium]